MGKFVACPKYWCVVLLLLRSHWLQTWHLDNAFYCLSFLALRCISLRIPGHICSPCQRPSSSPGRLCAAQRLWWGDYLPWSALRWAMAWVVEWHLWKSHWTLHSIPSRPLTSLHCRLWHTPCMHWCVVAHLVVGPFLWRQITEARDHLAGIKCFLDFALALLTRGAACASAFFSDAPSKPAGFVWNQLLIFRLLSNLPLLASCRTPSCPFSLPT